MLKKCSAKYSHMLLEIYSKSIDDPQGADYLTSFCFYLARNPFRFLL